MIICQDCRYFKGDIPCIFHKQKSIHCNGCPHYEKTQDKILIIKLGAIGDVIRTTPLLTKIKKVYPSAEIFWLTNCPEVVPEMVDHILCMELPNVLYLYAIHFDILYNLDKDREACALASLISANTKKGFILKDGKCSPVDQDAVHKFNTGIFDDINRENQKSYIQEVFEICGFTFEGERYILPKMNLNKEFLITESKPLIGLNIGCGARWGTRLWPEENWISLAMQLKSKGYGVLLLGGELENEKNIKISGNSGSTYLGYYPLKDFFALINQCDLIVTCVTMALHIAIGLNKKIILFNNIFNKNEFELYDTGTIIEPEVDCIGCYRQSCNTKCMELITVDTVLKKIEDTLSFLK
jgi:ADP-heptose:LPS heptosyltransferase